MKCPEFSGMLLTQIYSDDVYWNRQTNIGMYLIENMICKLKKNVKTPFHMFVFTVCCSILTGWGKHSKVAGDSTVKRAVESRLLEIRAPFHVGRYNEGRLVCAGHIVRQWLQDPRTLDLLILQDIVKSKSQLQRQQREHSDSWIVSCDKPYLEEVPR